jgi:hypothetical protein
MQLPTAQGALPTAQASKATERVAAAEGVGDADLQARLDSLRKD